MKRLFILIIAAIGAVSITSCKNDGYLAHYYEIDEIKDVMLINPVSVIEIRNDRNSFVDDSISQASQALLLQTIKESDNGLNINSVYIPEETVESEHIMNGVASLFYQVTNSSSSLETTVVTIPKSLDDIIEGSGSRYGLIALYTGYSRNFGNYALEYLKGIGKSLLTLGTFIFIPHKKACEIHAFIIDSEMDCLVWYNHLETNGSDHLSKKHIQNIFKEIFRPFNE